jgi:hypothetical protein
MKAFKAITISLFLLYSPVSKAYLALETSYDYGRQEFNQIGYLTTFVFDTAINLKLIYQNRPNKDERLSWGASYSHVQLEPAGSNPYTFSESEVLRTIATVYAIYVLPRGLYTRLGVSYKNTPYYRVTATSPSVYITVDQRVHIDPFIEFGSFYKNGFGAGEVSLKYTSVTQVEVEDEKFGGGDLQFYFNLYLNENRNFGFFFRYTNEFLEGSYDHVYDSRQMGFILRI